MSHSVGYTRARLSYFWRKAQDENVTLLTVLEAFRNSCVEDDEDDGGRVLIGTSEKGHSVTFSDRDSLNPSILRIEFGQMLVDAFNLTYQQIGGTPDDQDVFDAMMAKLMAPRVFRNDYSNMIR